MEESVVKFAIDARGKNVVWTRPRSVLRYHELRSDGGLYATIRWKNTFGSLAVGECREGKFTFKRGGFLRPYVTVRRDGYDSNLAVMKFASGSAIVNAALGISGTLEFVTGHRYAFHRLSFWDSKWAFSDENGVPLVTFTRKTKGRPTAKVVINEAYGDIEYIHILLMIGWYVMMLDFEEEEASAGMFPSV